jgi:hypothetical protein
MPSLCSPFQADFVIIASLTSSSYFDIYLHGHVIHGLERFEPRKERRFEAVVRSSDNGNEGIVVVGQRIVSLQSDLSRIQIDRCIRGQSFSILSESKTTGGAFFPTCCGVTMDLSGDCDAFSIIQESLQPFIPGISCIHRDFISEIIVDSIILWELISRMIGFGLTMDSRFIRFTYAVIIQFHNQFEVFDQLPSEFCVLEKGCRPCGKWKWRFDDEFRNMYLKRSKGIYQPLDDGSAEIVVGTFKLHSSFRDPTTFFLAWQIYISIRAEFKSEMGTCLAY